MQTRFCLTRSHASLPSLKNLRSRILALCGLKPVVYDCCKNSCVCFAGPFADLDACPECQTPRLNAAGAPHKTFSYIPLIPQLRALYCSLQMCKAMRYRHNFKRHDITIEDLFDSDRYCELLDMYVTVDGEQKPYKFFADWRDIALALSTDGMCPFKRRKNSCWPLILVNLNLPPEERTHLENLICVGVIPGPKSPKNLGSYLWPLMEELLQLASGVSATDVSTQKLFSLRAYLLSVFGDIPAITKLLEFVGHNGRYPCRFCLMSAVQGATAGGGTHLYCPLHRTSAPFFDPFNLPLRTHEDSIQKGFQVLEASSSNAQSKLATATGIKGVSALARLPSISIPSSFPIDVMHMIFINLIPQMVDLWTNSFNGLDDGKEDYSIDPVLFKALGEIIENSGCTIPAAYGCRVPNLAAPYRGGPTAEAWSIFGGYLGPCVLHGRFRKTKYYRHFVRLIKLVNQITSFKILRSDIVSIREGFVNWIQDYEKFYYQHNPARMQTCTVNIHYLLHVADCIEYLGPVWCYWSFPMERFCSFVGGVVKSRRFPFENIARRIRDTAQLQVVRHLYGLHDKLTFLQPDRVADDDPNAKNVDSFPEYDRALLYGRCAKKLKIHGTPLYNKICGHLVQSLGISTQAAKAAIPRSVIEWRRLRISQGGDTITANGCQKIRSDARDSSFVRYSLLVDKHSHHRNLRPDLRPASQYGRLEHIFALPLKRRPTANDPSKKRTLLLAFISEAPVLVEDTHEYKVVSYAKGALKSGEVVDARTIQCLLGRVLDRNRYWIIDRSADCEFTFPTFH
ncbi:transposase family Tnp2 protein [Rhizoctonia solani 123E]|uniref:Transposase family Tnp2 protein n=1 Tax=Rhizoctonia solani 123E TaxID=1423351 RepID=A0A074RYV0_9AGAM|nr:transposase family Tnp2 protein [Rhizoctonia solani 123E]